MAHCQNTELQNAESQNDKAAVCWITKCQK